MKWTAKEIDMLKKIGELKGTIKDAKKIFPYRTHDAIYTKASSLGISLAGEEPEPDFEAFKELLKESRKVTKL